VANAVSNGKSCLKQDDFYEKKFPLRMFLFCFFFWFLRCAAAHCNTLQHTALHCNALHHTASHYTALHHTTALQHKQLNAVQML